MKKVLSQSKTVKSKTIKKQNCKITLLEISSAYVKKSKKTLCISEWWRSSLKQDKKSNNKTSNQSLSTTALFFFAMQSTHSAPSTKGLEKGLRNLSWKKGSTVKTFCFNWKMVDKSLASHSFLFFLFNFLILLNRIHLLIN